MSSSYSKDWQLHELSDVCYFQEGPGLRNWQYRETGIKFINIRCIKEGAIDTSIAQCLAADEVHAKYKHFLLDEDDIVLSSSGTIGRAAVVKKEDLPLLLNTSVIRFRPLNYSLLDREYLYYFLQSRKFLEEILEQSQGSAQVNFGPTHLKQLQILLPPLPEQKKIAEILSGIDYCIEQLEREAAKYEALTQATLQEYPSRYFSEQVLLRDFANLQAGGTPDREQKSFWDGNIPWVKTGEVNYNLITSTEEYISEEGLQSSSARLLPAGSILMAMYGQGVTRDKVAKLGISASTNQACLAINSSDSRVSNDYLYWILASKYEHLRSQVQEGTQKNLSKGIVGEQRIPLLDSRRQNEFCQLCSSFDGLTKLKREKVSALSKLKNSVASDLLSGRKRVGI